MLISLQSDRGSTRQTHYLTPAGIPASENRGRIGSRVPRHGTVIASSFEPALDPHGCSGVSPRPDHAATCSAACAARLELTLTLILLQLFQCVDLPGPGPFAVKAALCAWFR